jgi:hypothetical protein
VTHEESMVEAKTQFSLAGLPVVQRFDDRQQADDRIRADGNAASTQAPGQVLQGSALKKGTEKCGVVRSPRLTQRR